MTSDILDNIWALWWVALTCTAAFGATVYGAMRGSIHHRLARMVLGVSIGVFAGSYWWDIIDPAEPSIVAAELRRGTHIVLWPAMVWVAVSGILFAVSLRRAEERLQALRRED